jgi:hypothetical protein
MVCCDNANTPALKKSKSAAFSNKNTASATSKKKASAATITTADTSHKRKPSKLPIKILLLLHPKRQSLLLQVQLHERRIKKKKDILHLKINVRQRGSGIWFRKQSSCAATNNYIYWIWSLTCKFQRI